MQQSEDRLLTFVNWPSRIPVRPDQLAQAGFYYMGLHDCVKCFCCYGVLQSWQSGDDPWVVHTKWFPRCEYVLQEKGQEFVHQIQARFPQLLKQLLTDRDNSSRECVDPPVVDLGLGEERTEDAIMMNTPLIKSALEMGFERSLIKQTVQSKILTGENYETVDELVTELVCKVVDLGLGEERTEDAIMMNTPVIKSALEMGFERSLIKQTQTVQSKILTGENYETVHELVSELVCKMVDLGLGEERTEDAIMMNSPLIKSALEMGFERSLIKQTVLSKILTGDNYETVDELVTELVCKAIEEEKQRILKENEEKRRKEEEELKKKCDGEALEKAKKIKEEQARCAREMEKKIPTIMEKLKKQEQQDRYARELEELKKWAGEMERQLKEQKETSKREKEEAMRKMREEHEREARKQSFGAVAAGAVAGGKAGVAIGTCYGPMGAMVGGTMGAAVGGIAGYFEKQGK